MLDFCYVVELYNGLLQWWVEFGPELPNGQPDPAFDHMVTSYVLFNDSLLSWYSLPGWDGYQCFLK